MGEAPREHAPRPVRTGGHALRVAAPAGVLWGVVRRISTGQRTLPDTVFEVDGSTGITTFGVGYEWRETRAGRTDRFRVTSHLDHGEDGGSYDVFVVVGGALARYGTRVTVTSSGEGSRLRFDSLLDVPSPVVRSLVHLARPVGALGARRAFGPDMRRIAETARREASG